MKLNYKGLGIPINHPDIPKLKKELTVEPIVNKNYVNDQQDFSYPVYRSNSTTFYMPKFFGLSKFNIKNEKENINISERQGEDINPIFNGTLRKDQSTFVNNLMNEIDSKGSCIACAKTGTGKCLAPNTPILMYNGTIKLVQHIKIGDYVMGPDSKPRKVSELGTGNEEMYEIRPQKGPRYTVNKSHILSLIKNNTNSIINISLEDYLKKSQTFKRSYKGYRAEITDFPIYPKTHPFHLNELDEDPYIYSMNLNDIVEKNDEGKIIMTQIPMKYKCSSRENRIKLLSGLIDKFGEYTFGGYFLIFNSLQLYNDVEFVARSLGFSAYKKNQGPGIKTYKTKISGTNSQLFQLKCIKLPFINNPHKHTQKKLRKYPNRYTFTIIPKGRGQYFGFTLDHEDPRFLLGDFTVTHNTSMALYILSQIKKKTLIVVHKEFLLNQWIERINQFLTNVSIGILRQDIIQTDKDIVIGLIQSISMKDSVTPNLFDSFGFVIFDETHHVCSKTFSKSLFKVATKKMLGLSATPHRKDGLTKVLTWFLGDIIYKEHNDTAINTPTVSVIKAKYDKDISLKYNYKGALNIPDLITKISNDTTRNTLIINEIIKYYENNRNIIVLSDRRQHCEFIYSELIKKGIPEEHVGLYLGSMKQEHLDKTNDGRIVLATYSMASEGYDNPKLDTLIMATGKSDIEQSVGRILRKKNDNDPLIIDIVDYEYRYSQFLTRKKFYSKNEFIINLPKDMKSKKNNTLIDEEQHEQTIPENATANMFIDYTD